MGLFKSDTEKHADKLQEEAYYAQVGKEISTGSLSQGLWTNALAESGGDRNKAEAIYIKLRVAMLKSEAASMNELERSFSKQISNKPNSPPPSPEPLERSWGLAFIVFLAGCLLIWLGISLFPQGIIGGSISTLGMLVAFFSIYLTPYKNS